MVEADKKELKVQAELQDEDEDSIQVDFSAIGKSKKKKKKKKDPKKASGGAAAAGTASSK